MLTNEHRQFLVALFLFFINLHFIQSQSNWSKGYYINLQGDTVRGMIEYKKWREQPNSFRFKPNGAKNEIILTSVNTRAIQIDKGNFYLTASVSYLNYSAITDKITYYRPDSLSKTVFLQRLVNGEYELFQFKQSDGTPLFFMRQHDSMIEYLTYYKILKSDNKISEVKLFLKQVEHFTNNCPAVVSCYPETNYNQSDLEMLFVSANNCQNSNKAISITRSDKEERFQLGTSIGINTTHLMAKEKNMSKISYPLATNIYLGLESIVKFHKKFRYFSLQNDLSFIHYQVQGKKSLDNTSELQEYKMSYLRHSLMLKYEIPIKPFYAYLLAGTVNGIVLSNWNKKTVIYDDGLSMSRQEYPALEAVDPIVSGISLGVNVMWKKYYIETRFEKSSALNSSFSTQSYIFKVGYWFWKK